MLDFFFLSDDQVVGFKELEMFASVYIEYTEIFYNIENFKTFKTSKYAKPINIKKFLYAYRKAEKLEEKINLLAINL